MSTTRTAENKVEVYSSAARFFHWLTVGLVAVQAPLGLYMAYRGNVLNVWDAVTNALYSSHKLIGVVILVVVLARLGHRLLRGAPAPEPTLEPWQKVVSALNHWGMYAVLIALPLAGYIGISLYPALDIFGQFALPGLVAPNQGAAATAFLVHWLLAIVLIGLVALHVAAALFHYFIRKDNVLQRMLPGARRRQAS